MTDPIARDRRYARDGKHINDFKTTHEKELQDQAVRSRAIVKEIEGFIAQNLINDRQTLLFDGSALTAKPALIWPRPRERPIHLRAYALH